MKQNTFWLKTKDDIQIFTRTWLPETTPKRVVQIAHGMCEHSGRYAPFAKVLVDAGYAVYASDRRGHGLTAKKPEDLGHLAGKNGWNLALQDLLSLTETIHQQHPAIPVFLLGHSMGSFLAQHYLMLYANTIQGVILMGTNGRVGPLLWIGKCVNRFELWRQGPKGRSSWTATLSFGAYNQAFKPNRTPFDWISRDPVEVDRYIQDPFCGFKCTNQFWYDLMQGLEEIQNPKNIARIPKECPILILAGCQDPVGNNTKGVKKLIAAYQAAELKHILYRFYPGSRHELLNESNRLDVYQDIIHWLTHGT